MNKKIKSTTLYRYNYPVNEGTEKGIKYSTTFFDPSGNVIEELKFNEDGEVEDRIINTYDENAKLIEMKNFYTDDELAEHNTYQRDDKGAIKTSFRHYQDGEKDTINFVRDADGNLIEKVTIDSYGEEESKETISYVNGKISQRKVEEYDELVLEENFTYSEKNILEEHVKWSIEDEDARYINRFDEKGRMAKILKYNTKEELLAKSVYAYNDDDTLKEIVEEFPGGKNTTVLIYDDNKNLIKQTESDQNGSINSEVRRKYNAENELIETIVEVSQSSSGFAKSYVLRNEYTYFES